MNNGYNSDISRDALLCEWLISADSEYLLPILERSVYPWQIIPLIHEYIMRLVQSGLEGFTERSRGVLVGRGARIADTAEIEAPAIIGNDTEIRHGAYLRGNVITGAGCVIGNSSEVKNSLLSDRVQLPHYNYVGDSVLGKGAHLGAGAIISNLRADKRSVVIHAVEDIETGMRKLGAILGDGVEIGAAAVINPGTVICKNTSVYPLTSLRGVYPPDSIIKDTQSAIRRE